MVKVTLDAKRGWDRLETKSPGWGSGDGLEGDDWPTPPHHDQLPDTPVPDSRIPNSEFRMAYGGFGIPHHEITHLGPRDRVGPGGRGAM
jgi:hypothetical protein